MYINAKLIENNPSFRMEGSKYNELLNSLKTSPEEGYIPVDVGFTIRTVSNNKVVKIMDSIVFHEEITDENPNGYFSAIYAIQSLLRKLMTGQKECLSLVQEHTVLMPIGVYVSREKEATLYFQLIIDEVFEEKLKLNKHTCYVEISEDNLNNLTEDSIMILPTLARTNTK